MDLPNGTYTTYTYNSRNWLTAITHKKSDNSTFLSISYEFDDTGNPIQATENNGDVTDYTGEAAQSGKRKARGGHRTREGPCRARPAVPALPALRFSLPLP
jgi:hypothetical protein